MHIIKKVSPKAFDLSQPFDDIYQPAYAEFPIKKAEFLAMTGGSESCAKLLFEACDHQLPTDVLRDMGGISALNLLVKKGDKDMVKYATISDIDKKLLLLFIGEQQLSTLLSLSKGEEGQFFLNKMHEIQSIIKSMPATYDQDGLGDDAVASLHYFAGGANWYITERDIGSCGDRAFMEDQFQAFGLADLFGDGGEIGYISLDELISNNVELDLHWTPITLGDIKALSHTKSYC